MMGLYGRSALSTVAAKGLIYISSFVALWLATRILSKPEFGAYAFGIALMWVASVPATLGLDQTVLVRIARGDERAGADGAPLVTATLLTALIAGSVLAGAIILAAAPLASGIDLPGLQFWLQGLAATIPLLAISSVFESWYVARGILWGAQLFPAIGHAMRMPLLLTVLLTGGGARGVVVVELAVATVPILLFLADRRRPRLRTIQSLARSDVEFAGHMLIARIASEGIRRIDVFMVGALATAVAVADYSIAARLVIVIELGRELLQPAFTSRVATLLARADRPAVKREYEAVRALSVIMSLAAAAGLILFGRPFLAIFGDFESAYTPLLILVAGGLVNVAFGANGHFLKMAGHATSLLRIRLLMLAALFAANLLLVPNFGATGAALASMTALVIANLLFFSAIWRLERIVSLDWKSVSALIPAVAVTLLTAVDTISPAWAFFVLALVAVGYACVEPRSWKPAAMELAQLRG